MKKFLIFLVSIIVVVTMGLTTYYFLRNEEIIDFSVKELYCNQGDIVTLADLGKVVTKENLNKKTEYDYNAGGEEVTAMFEYKPEQGYYVAKEGGDTTVVITTTNSRFSEFKIAVHIGNGSKENPYAIGTQADLSKIGNAEGGYPLDGSYILLNDIVLSDDFKPIGSDSEVGFSGNFDGNGHTISGLNLTSEGTAPVTRRILRAETPASNNSIKNAGFFSKLTADAKITNIKLEDVTISGSFETAGALAGVGAGTIRNVAVKNAKITNTFAGGFTGGLIGKLVDETSVLSVASVEESNITIGTQDVTLAEKTRVGGLIGKLDKAKVQATYARATIACLNDADNKAVAGGLVGEFTISATAGTIQESYSVCSCESNNFGAFIGTISKDGELVDGQYNILKYLVGNYCATSNKAAIVAKLSEFKDELFTRTDLFLINANSTSEAELVQNSAYYYYSIGPEKHLWDSSVWDIQALTLPQLKFNTITLEQVNSAYYMKDLDDKPINDKNAFIEIIRDAIDNNNGVLTGSYSINADVDLTGYGVWEPIALENCVLNFGGDGEAVVPHTIKNLLLGSASNGNIGLFTTMKNSAVMNLNLEGVEISAGASRVGALVGTITKTAESSSISNVHVTYKSAFNDKTMDYFGGLVGYADSVTIENCSVANVDTGNSKIKFAGGLVGKLASGSVAGVNVNVTNICGTDAVAGLVAVNAGTIKAYEYTTEDGNRTIGNSGDIVINYSGKQVAKVGGVVAENTGSILNGTFNVEINVKSTLIAELKDYSTSVNSLKLLDIEALNTLKVGGIAGLNTNNIENVTIFGAGIKIEEASGNSMIVGGLVATNQGTLKGCACNVTKLGGYFVDKTYVVGGIAGTNSVAKAYITQCSVSADIEGNYVAGVVVSMNDINAVVEQVFVGKCEVGDAVTLSANLISGNKFVAGICYNFNAGKMSDIQTKSQIYGKSNDTISSLNMLIFPDHASIIRASIDSYCNGYGKFYRDTWKDFTTTGSSDYYNIYGVDKASGTMQQVVYNRDTMATAGKSYIISKFRADVTVFVVTTLTYQNTAESSYVRELSASEFEQTRNYTSSYTFTVSTSDCEGSYIIGTRSFTKGMNFDFVNEIWKFKGAIVLGFMVAE